MHITIERPFAADVQYGRASQYTVPRRSLRPRVSQRHVRSAEQTLLHVPRHRLNTYGRRAFCHCWSVRVEQSHGPCPQPKRRTVLAHRAYWGRGGCPGDALYKSTY